MSTAPLSSWNDGAARSAILDFVERSADVPPAERIATFDNDGTLWCEKPAYVQAMFILARLREQADADPALAARPVVQALLAGDLGAAAHAGGTEELVDVLLSTHSGLTAEAFAEVAAGWLAEARHPRFERPFADLVYAPMLELLELLRGAGFRVFVVTGGGVEFVRAASERLYGIGPDDVVGSAVEVAFERRDGRVVLVRQAKLMGSPNEGAPKALNIQAHVGRRPIFAAGNSAGDREMLEYATTGTHPSLALVVNHDDTEREYAYAGQSVTDPSAEAIADTAARAGWTVVSMRDDWARVFA
ncbi:HAD family hydrolase [Baekduia sp. Peel2402]|uniref:HAD family hydrolase n=1 Tax=Baekduia sp. Peel2402 TaxID=3458296 RepID=UPI00403EF249